MDEVAKYVTPAIVGMVTLVSGYFFGAKKTNAETENIASKTLIAVIDELKEELNRLKQNHDDEITSLKAENFELRSRIRILEERE